MYLAGGGFSRCGIPEELQKQFVDGTKGGCCHDAVSEIVEEIFEDISVNGLDDCQIKTWKAEITHKVLRLNFPES